MPSLEVFIAGSIVVALNLYMLMGGADYGGGVWDLLASRPRARQQRDLRPSPQLRRSYIYPCC